LKELRMLSIIDFRYQSVQIQFVLILLGILVVGCYGVSRSGQPTVDIPALSGESTRMAATREIVVEPTAVLSQTTLPATQTPSQPEDSLSPTLGPVENPVEYTPAPQQSQVEQQFQLTAYKMLVEFDYSKHHLSVEQRIDYINNTGDNLLSLALVVEPRRYPGAFRLEKLSRISGDAGVERLAQYVYRDTQIIILLDEPLVPKNGVTLLLDYELFLPPTSQYANIRPYPFGYTDRQANLGDWYPFIPPYDPEYGWVVHAPGSFGEHLVYDDADYDVEINQVNQKNNLVIAASAASHVDGDTLRFHQQSSRNFSWSASPNYKIAMDEILLPNGKNVQVMSYYFPLYDNAGHRVLETTAQALTLYSELFGPYPHDTLTAVQADFLDGMEYDGLYFLSMDYYNWHGGAEADFLVAIAAHETAHQWWYGMVGSDQAIDPWLDEGLSTYCERLFFEHTSQEALDWWWTYRINFYQPEGFIDISIYDVEGEYSNYRGYRDVVYLNGALFFEDLRKLVGDQEFFTFLRSYLETNNNSLTNTDEFIKGLQLHMGVDLDPILEKYFASQYSEIIED